MNRFFSVYMILMVVVVVCASSSNLMAKGLGIYGTLGTGSGDWEEDLKGPGGSKTTTDRDSKRQGVGFVFDTAVAKDQLFNYRLNLGISSWEIKRSDGYTMDWDRYDMTHDFGFGVIRNQHVRLWVGPEVRLTYSKHDGSSYDSKLFGFGLGPVVGLNFNFNNNFSLGAKVGVILEQHTGEGDFSPPYTLDLAYDHREVFLNIAGIYRIKDDRY